MAYQYDKTGLGGTGTEQVDVVAHSTQIYTGPPREGAIADGDDVYIYPTHAVNPNGRGPVEFIIPPEVNSYTSLTDTRVEGTMQVLKEDGSDLAETDIVSVVNMPATAVFSQVNVHVNGVQVTDNSANRTYPYNAYFINQLSYNKEAKEGHLNLIGYQDDTSLKSNNTDPEEHANLALRLAWFKKSKKWHFSSPIYDDLFQSERLFDCNSEVKITFIRNDDPFVLLAKDETKKYKIVISDMKLSVRKIRLTESAHLNMEKTLMKTDALYPIQHTVIKSFSVPASTSATISLFRGKLPSVVVVGLVKTDAYTGSYTENPFHFHHHHVSFMTLKINGKSYPSTPFEPDFSNGKYAREVRAFYDNTGIGHRNFSNITPLRWANGNTIWVFDTTPDKCFNAHIHPPKHGVMDLQTNFKAEPASALTAVVYALFNEVIAIGQDRKTLLTF